MILNTNSQLVNHLRTQSRQRLNSFAVSRCALNNTNGCHYNWSASRTSHLNHVFDQIREKCGEKLLTLGQMLAEQCNFVMALRVRRMTQICTLYTRIYSESTVNTLVSQLLARIMRSRAVVMLRQRKSRSDLSLKYMLSAACGVFCWDKHRISDRDMKKSIDEFVQLDTNYDIDNSPNNSSTNALSVMASSNNYNNYVNTNNNENLLHSGWEAVVMKEQIRVWRKPVKDSSLYKYKVFGSFDDVSARVFFQVQMDTNFRKIWDKLIIKLDVVDRESFVSDYDCESGHDSGNEVLHWVMKYPYPMYSREYVYVRRSRIDTNNNVMVIVSKSIEHPNIPESNEHIRVVNYFSRMVIKPHKSFDDNGFDYMLTYFDDPRAAFPSISFNWMAACGVPDFVEKLHSAALQLTSLDSTNTSKLKNAQQNYNQTSQSTISSSNMSYSYA